MPISKQLVAVDGAVQEADGRKVRKFEGGFAAGFRLSKGGGNADGQQHSQCESLFCKTNQETRYRVASLERITSEPGAHHESSK